MHTFHRNKKILKNFFHWFISVGSGGSWIWTSFMLLAALASYQPVTCLQPIGDTQHICRKGGNETGRHLVLKWRCFKLKTLPRQNWPSRHLWVNSFKLKLFDLIDFIDWIIESYTTSGCKDIGILKHQSLWKLNSNPYKAMVFFSNSSKLWHL